MFFLKSVSKIGNGLFIGKISMTSIGQGKLLFSFAKIGVYILYMD